MALDWDNIIIETDEYSYSLDAQQRMIIFQGEPGARGISATVRIGAVTTLPAGSSATVRNSGTVNDAVLDFGIPQGEQGEKGEAGGGAEWGDIVGTLSNQTDLQNALNARYTKSETDTLLSRKADSDSLGDMASEDDAPTDGKTYGRKNGAWSEVTGGSGGNAEWGDISGTLSDQTDLQTALNAKANTADLGDLATEDDALSDGKTYGRKNGAWSEIDTSAIEWGDISGTLSNQTDLKSTLDDKASAIVVEEDVDVVYTGMTVEIPANSDVSNVKIQITPIQEGSGVPSPSNIRPISGKTSIRITTALNVGDPASGMEVIGANFPATVYGGEVDVLNSTLSVTHGYIESYSGETLPGEWISDRDEYAEGTTPTIGAQVVYELSAPEAPIQLTTLSDMVTKFPQNLTFYMWSEYGYVSRVPVNTNVVNVYIPEHRRYVIDTKTYVDDGLAVKADVDDLGDLAYIDDAPSDNKQYARRNSGWVEVQSGSGGSSSWGSITGTLSDQTDLQSALNAKANTADLGDMASEDDAPSDSKTYGRKNGAWAEVTGGSGSAEWGDIGGTLSDQTDLQNALDAKADSADLGDLAGLDQADLTANVTGILPIANGGTGANNAADALTNLGLVDSGLVALTNASVFTGTIYYRQIGPFVHVVFDAVKLKSALTGVQIALLSNGSLPAPFKTVTVMGGANDYKRFGMGQVNTSGGLMFYRYQNVPNVSQYDANATIFMSITYMTA